MPKNRTYLIAIPKELVKAIAKKLGINPDMPTLEQTEIVVLHSLASNLLSSAFLDYEMAKCSTDTMIADLKAQTEGYLQELAEEDTINISFKTGKDTHHYILTKGTETYTGDIRYTGRQARRFQHVFGLDNRETEDLEARIVNEYLEWRKWNSETKVRYEV